MTSFVCPAHPSRSVKKDPSRQPHQILVQPAMLGAQALRTKQKLQKAEQKEKEKRHRERIKSIEIQREKLHRAACEEAATKLMDLAMQPTMPVMKQTTPKHRHSLHASNVNHLHITAEDLEKLRIHSKGGKTSSGPQRSTSSEHCRSSIDQGKSNKFLKWLGLAGREEEKDDKALFKEMKKRRMSTFT